MIHFSLKIKFLEKDKLLPQVWMKQICILIDWGSINFKDKGNFKEILDKTREGKLSIISTKLPPLQNGCSDTHPTPTCWSTSPRACWCWLSTWWATSTAVKLRVAWCFTCFSNFFPPELFSITFSWTWTLHVKIQEGIPPSQSSGEPLPESSEGNTG